MKIQKPVTPFQSRRRKAAAYRVRLNAARRARSRKHPKHRTNREEDRSKLDRMTSFRKGLPHCENGTVAPEDYDKFREACESQSIASFKNVPTGVGKKGSFRKWESPTAGAYYDLEGADAQAVTMPPAPRLGSQELALEMAEVYFMALLRDVPFSEYAANRDVKAAAKSLSCMPRSKVKGIRGDCPITTGNIFRGEGHGVQDGPLVSQFMMVGTSDVTDQVEGSRGINSHPRGLITYGGQLVDQKVRTATPNLDFMQTLEDWVEVQRGTDVPNNLPEYFVSTASKKLPTSRFITNARDMATYVHFDQLYQAYFNACLIMLASGVPFQEGFPHTNSKNTTGFAQFGGPHVLTLLTEVATRALKAVRYQKFTLHRRARPEQLAGLVSQYKMHLGKKDNPFAAMRPLVENLDRVIYKGRPLLETVLEFNKKATKKSGKQPGYFLPMAFPEGSPMHPSYGAGHATVAGACVTVLKAFFETGCRIKDVYGPSSSGRKLKKIKSRKIDIEGELNKLAANISVGRNMAGVHYYTDYSESLIMGEQVACSILEEQLFTYPEKVRMKFRPFFGGPCVVLKN